MMKKLLNIGILFFLFFGSLYLIIRSQWIQNKAFVWIQSALQDTDYTATAATVLSIFPILDVEDVRIEGPPGSIQIGKIQGSVSLWRLIKKEIYFTQLTLDQVFFLKETSIVPKKKTASTLIPLRIKSPNLHVHNLHLTNSLLNLDAAVTVKIDRIHNLHVQAEGQNLTSPQFHFTGKANEHSDGSWIIDPLRISTDTANADTLMAFDSKGKFLHATAKLHTDHIHIQTPLTDVSYQVLADIDVTPQGSGFAIQTKVHVPNLTLGSVQVEQIEGTITSIYAEESLKSQAEAKGNYAHDTWTLTAPFSWQKGSPWTFPDIALNSSLMQLTGNLTIQDSKVSSAFAAFSIPHLHDLFSMLYGGASGQFSLDTVDQKPFIQVEADCLQISYGKASAEQLWVYAFVNDLMDSEQWAISCDVQGGKLYSMHIDSLHLDTASGQEKWPFSCVASGSWIHPIAGIVEGSWRYQDAALDVWLEDLAGTFFAHSFHLQNSTHLLLKPNEHVLDPVTLQMADGNVSAQYSQDGHKTELQISATEFPLDIFSLNPLDVSIQGTSDLEVSLKGPNDDLTGLLSASIKNGELLLLGGTQPLTVQGNLSGHLEKDRIQAQGIVTSEQNPVIDFDLSFPLHLSMHPTAIKPLYAMPVRGHLHFGSRIEKFLDFIDLGTHRIEGVMNCNFALGGTLGLPSLHGQGNIQDGYYQNYYTGTELENIQADFIASGNQLKLTSFVAQDAQHKGSFEAKGAIQLLPQEQFPFSFEATVHRLNCATFDLVTTEASGEIHFTGNFSKALVQGKLDILESDITIPSRVAKTIPKLDVVYKHAHVQPAPIPLPPKPTYPLYLDLNVSAPDGIFISGRGIESEWKGDFHVGGTQIDFSTQGTIELLHGTFLFSGRAFKLTEGSLEFSGVPNVPPKLNLGATIQVKDVLITVFLKGPLNDPQITLQSSPPLPMGTIMSYLLFGGDMSELSSAQALQFATALTSIAGGSGPNILEQTKKSLGVDRIEVVTISSPSAESGEVYAIQVGKYVSEGVLVSYTQGAENSAGNINIEVELKNNLSFILESDQAQEQKQGKFTLKWNKTY